MPQEEWDAKKFIARIETEKRENALVEIGTLSPEQLRQVIDIVVPKDTRLKKTAKGLPAFLH